MISLQKLAQITVGATPGISWLVPIGYGGTGVGGTVIQAASKATAVTLSKATGQITLNNANLASDTAVSFTLTNTLLLANDRLEVFHQSVGTQGAYTFTSFVSAGSAVITVQNVTAGGLAEAIVLGFYIVRLVIA